MGKLGGGEEQSKTAFWDFIYHLTGVGQHGLWVSLTGCLHVYPSNG